MALDIPDDFPVEFIDSFMDGHEELAWNGGKGDGFQRACEAHAHKVPKAQQD